ncbi:MAG: T9SS type A sorting domain-containing protein, partial [Methanococcaceae archaeon]
EFMVLTNPVVPIDVVGTLPKRPAPIVLNVSDFIENGMIKPAAEKYENMYVEFRNVTTYGKNTSSGVFQFMDDKGNSMFMYNQSGYFTLNSSNKIPGSTYQAPNDGTVLNYIRGTISNRIGTGEGYYLAPLYPEDMQIGYYPPAISTIKRDADVVTPSKDVKVTSIINDADGNITESRLYYHVNGSATKFVTGSLVADSATYAFTIPGVKDSAIVDYYVWAKDNSGRISINPSDTVKGNYFYMVLNRPLNIQDVQYSPFGGNYTGFNGYKVTVSGIVTADTSDIQGDGTSSSPAKVFIQNGTGPWSGIQIFGTKVLPLKRGDKVSVTGTVTESSNMTRIDVDQLSVVSTNNTVPEATLISTSDIADYKAVPSGAVKGEQWEDVLVKFGPVTVKNENADGNPGPNVTSVNYNYGEILVADNSGISTRVEVQEGNHKYHNYWTASLLTAPGNVRIKTGDKFSGISGIMTYTFSNYKLVPRRDEDFAGYTSAVVDEAIQSPVKYNLAQNYPNPFNPSTTISYSIPEAGFVSIKIFNILGQEIKSLMNSFQNAGSYKVSFDASTLPSGIYIYQLSSGSFNSVKKMMLLK